MRVSLLVLLSILVSSCASKEVAAPPPVDPHIAVLESVGRIEADPDFVDVARYLDGVEVLFDLRYASVRNFLGHDLYGPLRSCYLHNQAAEKLQHAAEILARTRPGARLLVYDCLRPRSVQEQLWRSVAGTPNEKYVADPEKGSLHNFGFAVDLSVVGENGDLLDMGTDFDDFTPLAEPRFEESLLAEGQLTTVQLENRRLLRQTMEEAGYIQLAIEWWHFDALAPEQVRSLYQIVE